VPKDAHLTEEEEEEALTLKYLREKYFCAFCKAPCIVGDNGRHQPLTLYCQQIWAKEIVRVVIQNCVYAVYFTNH